MNNADAPIPFISRLFVGAFNEFETELVFGEQGCISPREAHTFDEMIVVVQGKIKLTLDDLESPVFYEANSLIELPAGTMHQISLLAEENKLVIIHPDRSK